MPLHRVAESVQAEANLFDVAIIDEASQMTLPLAIIIPSQEIRRQKTSLPAETCAALRYAAIV